jgi:acyl-homoserine lactone acylase PvdQ
LTLKRKEEEACHCRRDAGFASLTWQGTTLIAAERTGRRARLIELDPKYADVAVQRWQEQTGRTARLDPSGQSFSEMVSEKMAAV